MQWTPAGRPGETRESEALRARPGHRSRRVPALILPLLLLLAAPASADSDDPFDFEDPRVPVGFHYTPVLSFGEGREPQPPSFSFRRNESRAVEAPTRYRTSSILKYSRPLGDTGLILRVKLPLKQRKIIKLELRF